MKKKSKSSSKKRRKTSDSEIKESSNDEDALILEKSKKDPLAYESIYKKYANDVYNYIWYRVGHDADIAEDLTQEVFVRAFKNISTFEQRGYSYRTYLFTIARNILANHFRKKPFIPLDEIADVPDEITVEQEITRKLLAERLWRAIQNLSINERDALLMFYRSEIPIKDIAIVMNKTPNAVKILLSRARKKLKEHPHISDIKQFTQLDNRPHTMPAFKKPINKK